MSRQNSALVIIPTYNESMNVGKMIELFDQQKLAVDLLIIDDNSPDGTAQLVESKQSQFSWLRILKRKGKLGLGTAYIMGFKWALEQGYHKVITMDCDFSHEPTEIPQFLNKLDSHDLVVGSRYIGGIRIMNWPMHRLLLSYFASIYARIVTGIPFSDSTGGFNGYSSKALSVLKLDHIFSVGYAFQIELKFKVWSKGLPCIEHPITFFERNEGQSKMSKKIVIEAVINVFRLRLKKILGTL